MEYRIKRSSDYLAHAGKKGMKWGYTDGKKNGKRTAEDVVNELADSIGYKASYVEEVRQLGLKYGFDSKEYKDELKWLSEGDPDQAAEITKVLKSTSKKSNSVTDKGRDRVNNFLNRPLGREKNVSGQGKAVYRRGSAINK